MRTKMLLGMAAVAAAGIISSSAQVYSVNAVGYVNVTVPGDYATLACLANPLNGTNNAIGTILPLADTAADTRVFIYDPVSASYTFSDYFGGGVWYPDIQLPPGVGFFIQGKDAAGGPVSITFVGEVPQGAIHKGLEANPYLSLASSIVPQAGGLSALGFPGESDDAVYVWDAYGTLDADGSGGTGPAQSYVKQIFYGAPDNFWFPNNTIPVAMGFFVEKAVTSANFNWDRSFSVNP